MNGVRETNTTAVLLMRYILSRFITSKSRSKHLVLLDVPQSPTIILAHH